MGREALRACSWCGASDCYYLNPAKKADSGRTAGPSRGFLKERKIIIPLTYARAAREGPRRMGHLKMSMGAILGAIGGVIALVGTFLSWATFPITGTSIPVEWPGWAGFGFLTLIFAIIGLILVLIPKKVTAIIALVMGILALVFALLQYLGLSALVTLAQLAGYQATMGVGAWITIIGCILLIVGSGMAMSAAGKMQAQSMPMAAPPPPM